MLDKLRVLIQSFPRVISDMNGLESEFLEYQATPDDELPVYFEEMISPYALIIFSTKYLNKLTYTLVNLVLKTLQNLLHFYF